MYDVRGLFKIYGRLDQQVYALKDVDLRIEAGSFVAINGPSGSGKTTLLLTLGGLIRPSSGCVKYGQLNLYDQPALRLAAFRNRNIGFVLQTFNLVPYLSAVENVMLPMIPVSGNGADLLGRAFKVLEKLGLGNRMNFLPRQLSVGQQQRVAIARALANAPDVILADEPTGNLDPALADEVLEILRSLNKDEGKTVIIVTHSPHAAASAGAIFKLVDGKLES